MGTPVLENCLKFYKEVTLIEKIEIKKDGVKCFNDFKQIANIDFDIVIIAVKPQHFGDIADEIAKICNENTIVVSIMAGINAAYLAKKITKTSKFIRVMPNLGMMLESGGINAIYDGVQTDFSKEFVENIFGGVNECIYVDIDKFVDTFTPITGCGIAYFLLLAKIMFDRLYLTQGNDKLVRKLMQNAVDLSEKMSFDEAISRIASKAGVTEAALKVMKPIMENGVTEGINSAMERLNEISKDLCK